MKSDLKSWLAAALLLSPITVFAVEPIEEIIVTADFRERTLVDVPFSVSVMNSEFVEDTAVQHFEELVNIVPNMNWSGDGHRARYFQIRGVGELEQYQGAPNPSIGFLIDDIDLSGIGTVATLFDVETIEVLRGPQGSRYGANALGGLIYVRSSSPTAERSGRVQVTAGSDDALTIGAAFGAALNAAESLSFRISAQQHSSDGFRQNSYLSRDDSNGRDEFSLRAGFLFEPSEIFSAKLAVMVSDIDNGYDAFALDNSYTTLSDKPGKDAQQSVGVSLRLDWFVFDDMTMTSITSLADSDIDFSFDADWGNEDSWTPVTYDYISLHDRKRKTVSQEFRFGNEQWLFGLYALKLQDDILSINLGDYYDPFYDFSDSLDDTFGSDYEATNLAAFGQYNIDLSETTQLSTGLRIERRSTDYFDTAGLVAAPSETMWGGELSLSHAVNDASHLYATVSKGYKAEGFNLGFAPPGKRDFDAEAMWTLEAGVKTALFDKRLLLTAAIFQNDRKDQQVRTSTQLVPGDPASFVFFTDNVGNGTGHGVELEMRFNATAEWQWYTNIGWLDASLASGRQQAHAPRFTLAAGVSYRNPNGFFARLDATAKDDFYFDVSHDQQSEPFELLNVRLGFENEAWLVSLWTRNLLDRNYTVRGFYFGNEPPDFPNALYTRLGDPRQVGVTLERRF